MKKQVTYKGTPIRLSADFSAETLQTKSDMMYLKWWKEKTLQSRILYPERLAFRFDKELRSFTDKAKTKGV